MTNDEFEKQHLRERGKQVLRKKKAGAVRPHREDGYVNLLNKYGTAQDNSEAYKFDREPIIPDMQLTGLYEGNGLFSKIIDTPAEEALKHGFDLNLKSDELNAFVEDALDDLEWEEKAATAIKWARLYGGALIVMLIDDGRGLEDPVDWEHIRSIDELRVYERAIVQPDYSSLYQRDYGGNGESNRVSKFGQPEYYYVSSIYGSFRVHESRCLVFRNGVLPEQTSNATYRFWGMPEYVRIHRALRETVTAHTDSVKLLERSVQAIYSMKGLASLLTTDDGENQVLKRLQLVDTSRGLLNSIAIDSEGENYDFKTFQFSGVKDVIDSTCNMLSALTNIPQTILFGRSPAGMNATGDSDFESYYNFVEKIQRLMLKRNLRTLLDVVFRAGIASGDVTEEPDYKLEFKPLWSLSDTERAAVDQTKAQTAQIKAQTAQLYVDMQAIDPSEVRSRLASDEEFDIEDIVSEDDENDLFKSLLGTEPTTMSDVEAAQKNLEQLKAPGGAEQSNMDAADDEGWVTINGTHVLIDENGVAQSGGKLKGLSFSNAKSARAQKQPSSGDRGYEKGTAETSGSVSKERASFRGASDEKCREYAKTLSSKTRSQIAKQAAQDPELKNLTDTISLYTQGGYALQRKVAEKLVDGSFGEQDDFTVGEFVQGNKFMVVKDLYKGQGLDESSSSTADGMAQLIGTINQSEPYEGKLYRAAQDRNIIKIGGDYEPFVIPEVGQTVQMSAPTSFTTDKAVADKLMTQKMGDRIFYTIDEGANAVDVSKLSPYKQKEMLTCGTYEVVSVKKTEHMNHIIGGEQNATKAQKTRGIVDYYGAPHYISYDVEIQLQQVGKVSVGVKNDDENEPVILTGEQFETRMVLENVDAAATDYGVGVLVVQDGRFLCGTRLKEGTIGGPGGHIEAGESPEDAAIREAQEEFGITPKDLIPVAFLNDLKAPYCPSHVFLCTDFDGSIKCADGEMSSPGFITAEKVVQLSSESPERLFPPFARSITALLDVLPSNSSLTSGAQNAKMKDRMDFNEADHPRDENGRFTESESSGSSSSESESTVSPEGKNISCKGFADSKKKTVHFQKHGTEFGFSSEDEYEVAADKFLQQPCGGDVIGYSTPKGKVVRFNVKTTEYASGFPGQNICTYMKAKRGKNGELKPDNAMAYYNKFKEKDGV